MRVSWREIPGGNAGVMATVREMKRLAIAGSRDREVGYWADQMAPGACCPGAIVDSIREFLTAHVLFEPDPTGVELVRSPLYMVREIGKLGYTFGDCDDVATFGAALGMAHLLPARFRLLSLSPDGIFSHVYAELWTGPTWEPLDTTAPAQFPEGMAIHAERVVEI